MLGDKKQEYEAIVLIGVVTKHQNKTLLKDFLDELAFLAITAGGFIQKRFYQRIDNIDPKTYVGSGKIDEISIFIKNNKTSVALFDDELTPAQQKNIERLLKCKVVDRTGIILDIFAQRAKTSYATTQVELAQYEYLLPRLTGLWTHLERQRGGVGMRGPGETEIETDRRIVRNKISLLKKRLVDIDKQMTVQRSNRGSLVRVALVGYTNVGKSTLMNSISKSKVFAENKLFATLDTTIRKVTIGNLPFLLGDTVGFIRKLPTQLIAAFKSTLDEVREADILLHVVDISHPRFEEHIKSVYHTLEEIKANKKSIITVFNKIDAYEDKNLPRNTQVLEFLKKSWIAHEEDNTVFVSFKERKNINTLKQILYKEVRAVHILRFPYNHFLYPDIPSVP